MCLLINQRFGLNSKIIVQVLSEDSNRNTEYTVPYSKGMTDAEITLVIKSITSASACPQHYFSYNHNTKNIIHFRVLNLQRLYSHISLVGQDNTASPAG